MTPQTTTPRIGGSDPAPILERHECPLVVAHLTKCDLWTIGSGGVGRFVFPGGWNKWQESTHPVDVAWRQEQKAKAA